MTTQWHWDPIPSKRSKTTDVKTIENYRLMATKTNETTELMTTNDFFQQIKSKTINGRRRTKRRFVDISPISMSSSDDSNESNAQNMSQNQTISTPTSTAYLPQYTERTIMECNPYELPFTPNTSKRRNSQRIGLFGDNTSFHRSFKSTTAQISDSLQRMDEIEDISETRGSGEDLYLAPEVPKTMRQLINEENNGLRRSNRNRIPRLEFWRGQRPIYTRDSTGITEKLVTVDKGSIEPNYCRKKGIKHKRVESSVDKRVNVLDLSVHNKVLNKIMKNKINSKNIKRIDDLKWKKSDKCVGVDTAVITKYKNTGSMLGMLRLEGNAEKKRSQTRDYVTHLWVTYGALILQLEDNDREIVRSGDYFKVDPQTNYSLTNARNDTAYLAFHVLKE